MTFVYQLGREFLRESLNRNSNYLMGKCLDVGAQARQSRYCNFLKVSEYVSLDIDPKYNPDIVASVEQIPVPDHSFDSILCSQMLDDVSHPSKALSEFHRILRKGGYIIISVPMIFIFSDVDLWRFTPKGLRLLLEESGFEVVKEECLGGLFAARNQLLGKFIKNKLVLHKRGRLVRGMLNKFFILYGAICKALDRVFQSNQYAVQIVVIARAQ